MLSYSIGGVDKTGLVRSKETKIENIITSQVDTCTFKLKADTAAEISEGQEIIITNENSQRDFGGRILRFISEDFGPNKTILTVHAVDYCRDLRRKLVVKLYENQALKAIVEDILSAYFPGEFTTVNVETGPTIPNIKFNYVDAFSCFNMLASLTGYEWYIDYNKDVHFFAKTSKTAPIELTDTSKNYWALKVTRDGSQRRNRTYVRGAKYWGNSRTVELKGDGSRRIWNLPYNIREVSIEVNGTPKSVGVDNLSDEGSKDFYFAYTGRIRKDNGGTVLTDTDVLSVTFEPEIPIRVVAEEPASIAERKAIEGHDGIHEHLVVDERIETKDLARDRAKAENRIYAPTEISGSFFTMEYGLRSGQIIPIQNTRHNINGEFMIVKMTKRYAGDLNQYVYEVEFEG